MFEAPKAGPVTSAPSRAAVESSLDALRKLPGVTSVTDPYQTGKVAPNGSLALATVNYQAQPSQITTAQQDALTAAPAPARDAGMTVVIGGTAIAANGAFPSTVFIALAGLAVVGIPFLTVMGLAAAGTVAAAVLIAHTLLPALLGFAGRKVIGTRIPGVRRPDYDDSAPDAKTSFGERWARLVTRRRGPVLIAGVALSRWLARVLPNVDIEGQSLLDRRPDVVDAGETDGVPVS